MNKRTVIISGLILCLGFLVSVDPVTADMTSSPNSNVTNPSSHNQEELPNIVVFISDDLGRLETSIHGSPDVMTPNMERLAATGLLFENAYVASPSCCPNRYSLLTGLMPARHGAHPNHSQVDPDTEFLIPILKSQGYRVASFGKVAHGRHEIAGCDHQVPRPTDMHENVANWLAGQDGNGPICLLVGDRRPHVTWKEANLYDQSDLTLPPFFIDTSETRSHWGRYLTEISGMDEELGRVIDIAEEKFGDNCLFLFTIDHGGQWPRGKWNLYDFGTRVPLVVRWPGKIQHGIRSDAMVSWVDIIPTLLDAAECDVPDEIDGRSFVDVLTGKSSVHRNRIFTTHTGDGAMNIYPMRSIRKGDWKLIHNLCPDAWHTNHTDRLRRDGGGFYWHSWDALAIGDEEAAELINRYYTRDEFELFNVNDDPYELNNRYSEPELIELRTELHNELAEWLEFQGDDQMPHREPYSQSEPIPAITRNSNSP